MQNGTKADEVVAARTNKKWAVKESTDANGLAVWHVTDGNEVRGPFQTVRAARDARQAANEAAGVVTKARQEERRRAAQREAAKRSRLRGPGE